MLHGSIAGKIILFAIPILLSSVMQQLFNAADMIVVGRYTGSNALAAVGANTFIINLMVNLFVGLSIGSNVVIGRFIGRGRTDDIHRAVHSSLAIALISGVALSVVGWCVAAPVLRLIGTPDEILPLAVTYFRIYFLGMPFAMLFNFTTAILRCKGDTRRPLYVLLVCGVINVLLNLLFVVGLGMGVAGVALATILSSALSSLTNLTLLMREEGQVQVRLGDIRLDAATSLLIIRIGLPAGLQSIIFAFSNVLVQSGINSLGAVAVAAGAAGLNFDYLCYYVQNAFAQAGMTFMSQNYGAGYPYRCRRIILWSLLLGAGCTFVVAWSFILFRKPLCSFFSTDAEVILLSSTRVVIVCACYFINSINDVLSNLMRALGQSLVPALICVIGICSVRVIWLYTAFAAWPSFDVLLYCYPLSWGVTALVMIPTAIYVLRSRIRKIDPAKTL